MDVKHPSNENLLNGLSDVNKRNYLRLRETMHEVASKRPDIQTGIYTEYLHDYLAAASKSESAIKAKRDKAHAAGVEPDIRSLRAESAKAHQEFIQNFRDNTLPKYGANGQQAWDELHKELQGPSIFSGAASQIYDKSKGGLRIGGIIGLIGGAFIASQLTGGFQNGLFGILSMLGAGFLAAWLGNKASDGIGNMLKSHTPEKSASPERVPEQQVAPEPEKEKPAEITPELKKQAYEEQLRKMGVAPASEDASNATLPAKPATESRAPAGGDR